MTRDEVAARLLAALPGATLRGSLADGTADVTSRGLRHDSTPRLR